MKQHPDIWYERREAGANDRGKMREGLFLKLFQEYCRLWPHWLRSIRKATTSEDLNGIDFVVETNDVGPIYIQTKGLWAGVHKYLAHPRPIEVCIVVLSIVEMRRNPQKIFNYSFDLVRKMRFGRLSGDRSKILF